jgi:hypothetical protein
MLAASESTAEVVRAVRKLMKIFSPFLVAKCLMNSGLWRSLTDFVSLANREKQARACLTPRPACWGEFPPQTPLRRFLLV